MKKTITLIAGLTALSSLNALSVNFSNTDFGFTNYLPITDSSGSVVSSGFGSVSVGYFTNEAAVSGGDFSSFVQFGSSSIVNGAGFDADGLYFSSTSQTVGAGSSFIDEFLFTFVSFNNEFLVAKSSFQFFEETGPTDEISMDIANDSGITFLFGGDEGFSAVVADGVPAVPAVSLAAVPEPSTYAALAGFCALGWVMLRRRRG